MKPATRPLPPDLILLHWYQCGRKIPLLTEPIAALACQYGGKAYFPCLWGDHWHIGRRPVREGQVRRHAKRAWWRMKGLIP